MSLKKKKKSFYRQRPTEVSNILLLGAFFGPQELSPISIVEEKFGCVTRI